MSVYIIMAPSMGLVKIGYSNNPPHRLNMLQSGSPVPLELAAVIPGSKSSEKELHKKFASVSTGKGEWFAVNSELKKLMKQFSYKKIRKQSVVKRDNPTQWDEIIDKLGGTTALSRLIEAPVTTVHAWRRNGIPRSRLAHIKIVAKIEGVKL